MASRTADEIVGLLRELVACPSVTPASAGAIELAEQRLAAADLACERFDKEGVSNLCASHGSGGPELVFSGHLDVVPPGDAASWSAEPFTPTEKDGRLYGRGTADMKGGVATFLVAVCDYIKANPGHPGTLGVMLTTDEEGDADYGTRHMVEQLQERGQRFTYGLVCEPTSATQLGDTLRVGRRGSLTGRITVQGRQGHAAFPDRHANPIPDLAGIVARLAERRFEAPASGVEPTIMQIVSLAADGGATNVVPGKAEAVVNFRHTPQDDPEGLRGWVEQVCGQAQLPASCSWTQGSKPYYTGADSPLARIVMAAASGIIGVEPQPSVGGGTSDGRFLADICDQVIEFGAIGQTMHQIDENIAIADLEPMAAVYTAVIAKALASG